MKRDWKSGGVYPSANLCDKAPSHLKAQPSTGLQNEIGGLGLRTDFPRINQSKAVFDDIYALDDPRAYFSILGDYMIPDVAEPVVRQILAAKASATGVKPAVLDVGCSYGINAAVHRFPLTFGGV